MDASSISILKAYRLLARYIGKVSAQGGGAGVHRVRITASSKCFTAVYALCLAMEMDASIYNKPITLSETWSRNNYYNSYALVLLAFKIYGSDSPARGCLQPYLTLKISLKVFWQMVPWEKVSKSFIIFTQCHFRYLKIWYKKTMSLLNRHMTSPRKLRQKNLTLPLTSSWVARLIPVLGIPENIRGIFTLISSYEDPHTHHHFSYFLGENKTWYFCKSLFLPPDKIARWENATNPKNAKWPPCF